MKRKHEADEEILSLNVGGITKGMSTTRSTLINSVNHFPQSTLSVMFSPGNRELMRRDPEGRYFLDYDGETFRHILNVVREPSRMEVIPQGMDPSVWWQALGYWGLVDPKKDKLETIEVEDKPFEMKSLIEIGQCIKREIMSNETVVIKTLLEKSGYYKSQGKDRSITIRVPFNKYQLPWACDIGSYIESHQKSLVKLLEEMMGRSCVVKIWKSVSKTQPIIYLFDEKEYTTLENHMTISLEFSFTLEI